MYYPKMYVKLVLKTKKVDFPDFWANFILSVRELL